MTDTNIQLVDLKKKQQAANAKIAHLQDRKRDLRREILDIDEEIESIRYELEQQVTHYTEQQYK